MKAIGINSFFRHRCVAAMLVVWLCSCASNDSGSPAEEVSVYVAPRPSAIQRVAVLPFKAPTELIGSSVSDIFTTELLRTGRYTLVERSQISGVLGETELSMAGLSEQAAIAAGRMLGADGVILGTVDEYGTLALRGRTYPVVGASVRMIDCVAGQRAVEMAEGIVEGAKKTVKFGWETSNELAQGAGKLVYGSPDDLKIAKEAMAERLVELGASPVGAEKAAESYYGEKDAKPLEDLKTVLAQKKTDRENAQKLKNEEAETDADSPASAEQNSAAGLAAFAGKKEADQDKKSEESFETLSQNSAMAEAAKAGDSDKLQAKNVKESSGQEFQDALDESSKTTAATDQKDSWGNTLGNALESGLTQGAETFGAELGNAAAEKANEKIYGPDKKEPPQELPPETSSAGNPPPPNSSGGGASWTAPEPSPGNAEVQTTSTDIAAPTEAPGVLAPESGVPTSANGTRVDPPSTTPAITTTKPAAKAVPGYSGTKACVRCGVEARIPKQEQLCLYCVTRVMSSYSTYCSNEGRTGSSDQPYFGMLSAGTRASIEAVSARETEKLKNSKLEQGAADATNFENIP